MKIVLFDVDLTLLKAPDEANKEASRIMFREVFHEDAHEDLINNTGMTEMGVIRAVLTKIRGKNVEQESQPIEILDRAYMVWADATREAMKTRPAVVLPGIKELLDELSMDKGIILGILSGNSPWRVEAKLKSVGLDKYFRGASEELLGAFGNESETRDGLIDIAKNRLGKPGDTVILVDDSLIGAKMAKRNNVLAIMVATGTDSTEELSRYVPYVFEDFNGERWREVVDLIKRL